MTTRVISGAIHRAAFNISIGKVLTPALEPGSGVIPDNLATHRSDKAARAARRLKARLGRIGAGTFDQLIEAIGEICDLFTPDE